MAASVKQRAADYCKGLPREERQRAGIRIEGNDLLIPWLNANGYVQRRPLLGGTKFLYPKGPKPAYYATPRVQDVSDTGDSTLYILESPMDALYASAAEFDAIALGGNSIPGGEREKEFFSFIGRWASVALVFDNDGQRDGALERAVDKLARIKGPELYAVRFVGMHAELKDLRDIAHWAHDSGLDPLEQVALALTSSVERVEAKIDPATLLQDEEFKIIFVPQGAFSKPVPPLEFVVEGRLVRGDNNNFAGRYGLGKSLLGNDLAIHLTGALGDTWLGLDIMCGPVVLIDEENSYYELHRRLSLIAGDRISDVEKRLHVVSRQGLKLDRKEHVSALHAEIERIKPVVVILDSLARLHYLDENSSREMAYFHELAIKPICRDLDVAVMILDHPVKDQVSGKPIDMIRAVRGSGDKVAQTDSVWYLTPGRDDRHVILHNPRQRSGPLQEPLIIERSFEDGRLSHRVVDRGARAVDASQVEGDRDEIMDFVRSSPGAGARRADIVAHLGGDQNRATRAIDQLLTVDLLEKFKDPNNARFVCYWATAGGHE
ncbi:MAG: AAA family ATPase [Actinomycetota bacterium]